MSWRGKTVPSVAPVPRAQTEVLRHPIFCPELLRRAYVEARYNPGYKITKAQLEYLAEQVRELQRLTKKICEAKIESYLSERRNRAPERVF